jgi:RNA polymerase sigma factor (sigma-70 family)
MSNRSSQPSTLPPEESVFQRTYAMHHRRVLAYCARRASRADAWDAAAEVFLVAWRRLDQVPSPDDALPWLLGVARRVLANQRRTEGRRRRLIERVAATGDGVFWPDDIVVRDEEAAHVLDALSRLRSIDREILQLALWEELNPSEIAEVLEISRAAVDQRFSRAKRRLAGELTHLRPIRTRATRVTSEEGGAT